ncbi:nitroreductase family protein [Streptomyces sp. NPDC014733]|uniref:nitroreductase family protein n=1 Tax=Streptomyces sp. NPDC014733 TaxID=3364885 RepID=UPI0036F6FFFF
MDREVQVGTVEPRPGVRIAAARGADALDIIRTRAVVRSYTDEPVGDELLTSLLEAMLAAPSASNKQAWAFLAVREPERVRRVRAFAPGIIGVPPLVLVACVDHARMTGDPHLRDVGSLCVAMAVENFLLAAHAQGLGGCPVSSFLAEPVQLLLGLPSHLEPLLLVPVGRPDQPLQPSPRRAPQEVVRHEYWHPTHPG